MAVVDLDDMELLENATVQLELVVLEGGKDLAAEVDAHDIVQLLLGNEIALVPLQVVLDLVDITRVLEQCSHGLLASLDVLDISLGSSNLLDNILIGCLYFLERSKGNSEGGEIIDLSLEPMVKISEGVPQVLDGVLEALD